MVPPEFNGGSGRGGGGTEKEWELRPGGMLVQKRIDGEETRAPPPTIRVRVKYGSIYHEIRINCQATFGNFHFLNLNWDSCLSFLFKLMI